MKNKRLLLLGTSAIGVVVAALLVAPSFVDWSKYQSLAQEKLREATGYNLAIGGDLRIALLPTPHASVKQATLTKPGENTAFLTLDSASVSVALLPLLTGKIEVASVTLDTPVLTMVTHKDGTDNWKPVTKTAPAQIDAITGQPIPAAAAATPDIKVSGLNVSDGKIVLRDETTGKSQEIGIKELNVTADSLQGPFDVDGTLLYGNAKFDVDVTTGGYRKGETLPLQLAINDSDNRAGVKWSGVVDTGEKTALQGEIDVTLTDIAGVLRDTNLAPTLALPEAKIRLTGMLSANPDAATLTNGNLELGKSKLSAKFDVSGLKTGPKSVSAVLNTAEYIDVDSLLKIADKVTKDKKSADTKTDAKKAAPAAAQYNFIPADLTIPADMKADVQLQAKGLTYNGQSTGAFNIHANVDAGNGTVQMGLASLPKGGAFSLNGALAEKGVLTGAIQANIPSLKGTLTDWLGVVDAKTFTNPAIPQGISANGNFRVAGPTASVALQSLNLGATQLSGTISYTNAARPLLDARIAANTYTIAGAAKTAPEAGGKADEKPAAKAADFSIDPPQLPFDLRFDLGLGRLVSGDMVLSDIKAAGTYNGKGVDITTGFANVGGGALQVKGRVADLKELTGVDIQAGLTTSNLEAFVKGMTGKPLALPKPVGPFAGTLKAVGDRSKLDVDATAQALGFTVQAAGIMNDPFSAELPGTLNVRVRHSDFTSAVRNFSPSFGEAGAAKPIDLSGQVKISGKTYEVADLKGTIGTSDIAGSVKADMSGAVPAITASIISNKLDAGALVGVDSSKAAAASASASGGQAQTGVNASGGAPWSQDPLDTGALKAANIDLSLKAGTLVYGSWTLTDANTALQLKDGALKASPISGKLYDGAFDASLTASSAGKGSPLAINFTADVNKVAIGPFLQALTSSPKKTADGTGSLNLKIAGSGTSSAALVSSLSGSADVKTGSLVIYGMDLDKLAANMVEAFDGGWKGVLTGFATQGFSGGSTSFKDVDHTFPITGGDLSVKAFTLETTSANATLVANGSVNFPRWYMDIQGDVKVTQPKDTPVIGLRLAGPLNAPTKNVNSQALDNLIRSKVGDKVQDLLGKKLKGTAAEGLVNQLLGGGNGVTANPAPAATDTTMTNDAPANGAVTTTPDTATPATTPTQPAETQQLSPKQQLLNGLINQLGR